MICFETVKKYCNDDITKIENYDKAMADNERTWHCHHKLEIELMASIEKMIQMGLYYNRPCNELIFLTNEEHQSLHGKYIRQETRDLMKSHISSFKGKHHTEETKKKLSLLKMGKHMDEKTKEKERISHLGSLNSMYGKTHTDEVKEKLSEIAKTRTGLNSHRKRACKCIETGEVFSLIKYAKEKYNANSISLCCKGKLNYCGKLPDGTKLHWCYVEV